MKKELENLITLAGSSKFDTELKKIHKKYKGNPEAQKYLSGLIQKELTGIQQDLFTIKEELSLKKKLKNISEIVSLSYVAREYFNKTRHWLYQRINGNIVNGKVCSFTDDELKQLQFALKDISKKIGATSVL
jgi:hypothetical protein